ncbi:protein MpHD11 [Marchantia polymorpha subsp. ruderalis]|uniref:Homeobox domain-containing protein n=2 Tax=Marchantia polymorpha TaxID=3197 RepID=A0AAF6AQV9_MARPO|nr:hypothetical protein MARPO_0033s0004 [Marchantia polymorpha]BBM98829.1 hypothetical protein Mp_1g16560 [Marchantia polymorpha subsp. ruderalis]|eukprot:PTQ41576.1 hypothetical protein MARPO_0033s0004 [Marchantia polymorpha]
MMGSMQLDVIMAVEELHGLSARDMSKLLKDLHNFTFRFNTSRGALMRVDVQRLATSLPLHLLASVASTGAEPRFRYLLRGVRLLHSLSDLALRYPKLEQEGRAGSFVALLHAALVACCLYLLTAFVTKEWHDVVPVLLAHPKVDVFMDAAFDVVRRDIGLLQSKLRTLHIKLASKKATLPAAERVGEATAQQCEASLQVLQSLCQTQAFRDQLLHHKELCTRGGVLRLTLAVLKLNMPSSLQQSKSLVAFISRLKSKALSMLLKFCETESVCFLDEVAAEPQSMQLAELVACEVLALVRSALLEEPRRIEDAETEQNPMGSLHINAMRLADLFSDDSNFRNLVMDGIAPDLGTVLAAPPGVFTSRWCEGDIAVNLAKGEMDAILVYDPFQAAGAAMIASVKGATAPVSGSPGDSLQPLEEMETGCVLSIESTSPDLYARERSALLVKLFANLTCFNPEVCSVDEKDRFLHVFVECLASGPLMKSSSSHFLTPEQTAVRICENLYVLLDHVVSSSHTVNDEDLSLVSQFSDALHHAICPSPPSDESTCLAAPVVSYLRDAHEKKLLMIHTRRQELPRWQKIYQSSMELQEKEAVAVSVRPNAVYDRGVPCQNGMEIEKKQQEILRQSSSIQLAMSREESSAIAGLHEARAESLMEPLDEHEYDERHMDDDDETLTKEFNDGDFAVESNEDDNARGSQFMRNPKRRRESKKSLDSDEPPKKRKRNIMNERQIKTIEEALKGEPEMQRYPKLIQQWTNTLNQMGPEIAVHQLKNWLNNRKARLARIAREERAAEGDMRGENSRHTRSALGIMGEQSQDMTVTPPGSPEGTRSVDGSQRDSGTKQRTSKSSRSVSKRDSQDRGTTPELSNLEPGHKHLGADTLDSRGGSSSNRGGKCNLGHGQYVSLRDNEDKEVALGYIVQLDGVWQSRDLEEQSLCVIQVVEFKVDKTSKLPYPSNLTGSSFEEAETLLGKIRVAWHKDKIEIVQDGIRK